MKEETRFVFRQNKIPTLPGLEEYVRAIAHHCPYERPAEVRGFARYTVYPGTEWTLEEIVTLSIVHTEFLRQEYADIIDDQSAWLLNENIVFGAVDSPPRWIELLVAHWCTTVLYTDSGWVFGKFPKGLHPHDRTDLVVSTYQHDLFSIRKTIKETDERFYERLGSFRYDFANPDHGKVIVPEVLERIDVRQIWEVGDLTASVREVVADGVISTVMSRVVQKASLLKISPMDRYDSKLAREVIAVLSLYQ